MTCSLALDHGVHPPPLCAANKAKTDVATSVWFGVDVCYTEQVTMYIPRTFASDTRGIIWERCCLCLWGAERREGQREQTGGLEPLRKSSQIPLLFFALVLSRHVPAYCLLLTLWKMDKQNKTKQKAFCPLGGIKRQLPFSKRAFNKAGFCRKFSLYIYCNIGCAGPKDGLDSYLQKSPMLVTIGNEKAASP